MTLTREDVCCIYRISLGRPIENDQVADDRTDQEVIGCIVDLLLSSEFELYVLQPFLNGQTLRHATQTDTAFATVKAWAVDVGRFLFRSKVDDYAKWHQFLLDVIKNDAIHPVFSGRYARHAEFVELLVEKITRDDTIVGLIEVISSVRARGYVVDTRDPSRDLSLKLRLNGSTVALVPALLYRRNFQDTYGGTGRVGFEIEFETLPVFADLNFGFIDIIESSTGFVLLQNHKVAFSRAPIFELRDKVLDSLHGYRRTIDGLIEQLEGHGGRDRISVAGYGRARDFARRPKTPSASSTVTVVLDVARRPVTEPDLLPLLQQSYPVAAVFVVAARDAARGLVLEGAGSSTVPVRYFTNGESLADTLRIAETDLVVLVRTGEQLDPDAVAWLSYAAERPEAIVTFADSEDEVAGSFGSRSLVPVLRSALDIDLLLTSDEYDMPVCLRREAFSDLETDEPDGDMRLALLLRCFERHGRCAFRHVPLVLSRTCVPAKRDDPALLRRQTVQPYLDRTTPGATVMAHEDERSGAIPGRSIMRWPRAEPKRIAVVLPTKDALDMVISLIASLKAQTSLLSRLHIYIVSNNSGAPQSRLALDTLRQDEIVTVLEDNRPFNWSELNDTVIRQRIEEEIIVCLNNDMICETPDWDNLLRSQLARTDVNIVGGRLLYANGLIQHAGVAMVGAWLHEGAGDAPSHGLYRDRTRVAHECPVVTGAFIAFHRDFYMKIGGFDVENLPVAYNDVDFCQRAEQHGARILYDPQQVWIHFESETRGFDDHDAAKQERTKIAFDLVMERRVRPDYTGLNVNPHFVRHTRPFSVIAWPKRDDILSWIDQQETRNAARASTVADEAPGADQSDTVRSVEDDAAPRSW